MNSAFPGTPQSAIFQPEPVSQPGRPKPWPKPNTENEFDIRKILSLLQRRALIISGISAGVMAFSTHTALQQEPIYDSGFQVLVEPVNAENDVSDDLAIAAGQRAFRSSGLDYISQIQVLRSPELIEQVVAELQTTYPDANYFQVLNGLNIRRLGDTKIIEIRYQGTDPTRIQVTLDALAEVYLNYSLDERQTNLRQGLTFVDQQLPDLQERVETLQLQLAEFRRVHKFIDPESQAGRIAAQAQQIEDQQIQIDQQIEQVQISLAQLQSDEGVAKALREANIYQGLVQEMRQVETNLAAELSRFQPGAIPVTLLQNERQNLIPIIEQEAQRVLDENAAIITADLELLEARRQNLANVSNQLAQEMEQLPILAKEYADLQRNLQLATAALTRFTTTRENFEIEAAQTEIPWQLIQPPEKPGQPISPGLRQSLIRAMAISLLLGVGAAVLLEKLDTIYHTVDQLKEETQLPLLGTLPHQDNLDNNQSNESVKGKLGKLIPKNLAKAWAKASPNQTFNYYGYGYGSSQFLESLRVLQTNLQLLSSDRPIQSVLISSAMPGDGKSTVSRHLAQTAATSGKRVLLIDTDLRKPQVHKRLNLKNDIGMSDLLAGQCQKEDVIQQAMPLVEFYAITAGKIPPDPIKLLSSLRMQQLIQEFEKDFDLIVYDAPPIVGLADASLVAPHTDGLILVSRVNKTDKNVLKQALENLELARIPVLGLVANGVPTNSMDGYKYYSYGYESPSAPQFSPTPQPTTSPSSQNGKPKGISAADLIRPKR